jgi:hypothetical protein
MNSTAQIEPWLRQLAADRDGVALIIGKAIAALLVERSRERVALGHLCNVTGLQSNVVNTVVYRLRNRGRLQFNHRGKGHAATFCFSMPEEAMPPVPRERVWNTTEGPAPLAGDLLDDWLECRTTKSDGATWLVAKAIVTSVRERPKPGAKIKLSRLCALSQQPANVVVAFMMGLLLGTIAADQQFQSECRRFFAYHPDAPFCELVSRP